MKAVEFLVFDAKHGHFERGDAEPRVGLEAQAILALNRRGSPQEQGEDGRPT